MAFVDSSRHGSFERGAKGSVSIVGLGNWVGFFAFAQIAMAGAIYAGATRLKTSVNAGKKLVSQIIACALCESVGVFGFALAIMTKAFTDYAMFAVIAFAALLFYFPKEKDWKD